MRFHHFNTAMPALLIMALLLSSCDKDKKLDAERIRLTTERKLLLDEIASYENKTAALGKLNESGDPSVMDRSTAAMMRQTAMAEKNAHEKLQKWTQIEAKFNALREQTITYKAKNSH